MDLIKRTSTIVICVACFTLGVVSRTLINMSPVVSVAILFLAAALLLSPRFGMRRTAASFMVTLGIFFFGCGILRTDFAEMGFREDVLQNVLGQRAVFESVVVEEPDVRDTVVRLTVETKKVRGNNMLFTVHERVLVTLPLYPRFQYGDKVSLNGVLEKPDNFKTDLGREFDYVGYLKKDGIKYQMFQPKVTLMESGQGNFVKAKLFEIKNNFLSKIEDVLPEPYAALLGGLTVGVKQSLGKNLLDDLQTTGVVHMVVLSGYNVTIVAAGLMSIFSFLPIILKMGMGIFGIILFTIMTGAGATVVRASIMATLIVVGKALGREIDLFRLLAIAAFFMILQNPYIVVFDPSFQLSFMATLGLFLVTPLFEKRLSFVPEKFGLREVMTATIATQIFVLPLLIYMTGRISLVALVVNLLVLLPIPLTMLLGFLSGIFGFISRILSFMFAFVAYIFLWYEIAVVEFFAKIPFASVAVVSLPLYFVFLWYGVYGYVLWKWHKKHSLTLNTFETGKVEE